MREMLNQAPREPRSVTEIEHADATLLTPLNSSASYQLHEYHVNT